MTLQETRLSTADQRDVALVLWDYRHWIGAALSDQLPRVMDKQTHERFRGFTRLALIDGGWKPYDAFVTAVADVVGARLWSDIIFSDCERLALYSAGWIKAEILPVGWASEAHNCRSRLPLMPAA